MFITKTTTTQVEVGPGHMWLNDRRDSWDHLTEFYIPREDIAVVQFNNVANVFFGVNGEVQQVDLWGGIEMTSEQVAELKTIAKAMFDAQIDMAWLAENKEVIERARALRATPEWRDNFHKAVSERTKARKGE